MKFDRIIYSLSLVGLLSFYSCSSDDTLNQQPQLKGIAMPLTVTVNRGDVATRTELTENTQAGRLDDKWLANDQLVMFDRHGNQAGTLTLDEGYEGKADGVFSGTVTVEDGNYCLWYFGQPVAGDDNKLTNPYKTISDGKVTFDISNQSFKSAEELSAFDVMYEKVEIVVEGSKANVKNSVTMTPIFAMARFSLSGLGTTASGNLTIKDGDSDSESVLAPQYNLATGERVTDTTNGQIVINVTGVETGKDVYVALLPKAYSLNFSFTNTADSKVYNGKVTSNPLLAGCYYCILPGTGETALSGIPVRMKEEGVTDPYEGYENEDPRNPLHKFAKYNLVRVGDRGSLINGFASSETENGALYQWGRNYGFMSTTGMYEGTAYESILTENFSQWLDAFGYIEYDLDNYQSYPEYYVYNPTNNPVVCGVSGHFNNGYYWADAARTYTTVEELKSHPTSYVMDGNPMGQTQDYWIANVFGTKTGGSTWAARAEACGYTKDHPCPDGWRMPTEDEFRSIMPKTNVDLANCSLDEVIEEAGEQVRTSNGVKYAIKWINKDTYLEIQAIVVESTFKESDITDDLWTKPEVVVRKFPFTGFIDNVYGCHIYVEVNNGWGYYALPYHRNRTVNMGNWMVNEGHDGRYYPTYEYVAIRPGENYGSSIGCYWIGDGKKAAKFGDESSSFLLIEKSNPVMGYAIRPVMDIKTTETE